MKDGHQGNEKNQHYCDCMRPDHFVFSISRSEQARGLFSGETEEGLQTQEADMVEKRSEG